MMRSIMVQKHQETMRFPLIFFRCAASYAIGRSQSGRALMERSKLLEAIVGQL